MAIRDDLGKRMKEFYEQPAQTKLTRRMPVAIRIDGKAFHTFTRGFQKPFDEILMTSMQETMKYLCENIQGCVFGFTQSDEITLILIDYKKLNSSAWFDYEVQKLCSVAASMATMHFNRVFNTKVQEWLQTHFMESFGNERCYQIGVAYTTASERGAMFDARCFNIPKEEVANLIYWRQCDAIRNSIQMVAQANFSHKELQGKSCNELKDMLLTQKHVNWNHLRLDKQRGAACLKDSEGLWIVDGWMPIIKEDREYIEDLIFIESEE